jgi:hypothetical protein
MECKILISNMVYSKCESDCKLQNELEVGNEHGSGNE